jgi:hypothetical protein
MTRILNDVDRLARLHIPQWLATPGMGRGKIAAFYADPEKRRVDAASVKRSLHGRAVATSQSPYWRVRRSLCLLKRSLMPDRTAAPATDAWPATAPA